MTEEIKSKVILHSITETNAELISIETYTPYILDAEMEKHGMISSNSSSNRAIPFKKMAERDIFLPPDVRVNEPGMQGFEHLTDSELEVFNHTITSLHRITLEHLYKLADQLNIHKQTLNRYLTAFSMQKKILTATRDAWDGFLLLRDHEAADPSIQILAKQIRVLLEQSKATFLRNTHWHTPYLTENDFNLPVMDQLKVSSARCARTSYEDFDKKIPTLEKDLSTFDKLVGSNPKHETPLTHQGSPIVMKGLPLLEWKKGVTHLMKDGRYGSGNFIDFIQFRHYHDQTS